jgi:hypothetical protein
MSYKDLETKKIRNYSSKLDKLDEFDIDDDDDQYE